MFDQNRDGMSNISKICSLFIQSIVGIYFTTMKIIVLDSLRLKFIRKEIPTWCAHLSHWKCGLKHIV